MNYLFKSLAAMAAVSLLGFGCLPSVNDLGDMVMEKFGGESSDTSATYDDSYYDDYNYDDYGTVSVPYNFPYEISFPTDAYFYYAEVSEDGLVAGAMFSTATSMTGLVDYYTTALSSYGYVLEDSFSTDTSEEGYYTNYSSGTVIFVTATAGTDGYTTGEVLYGPSDY